MADPIHVEAKRSWWDGSSTTLCGRKILKAKRVTRMFNSATCPACKARDK